jgi:hypothetical protein
MWVPRVFPCSAGEGGTEQRGSEAEGKRGRPSSCVQAKERDQARLSSPPYLAQSDSGERRRATCHNAMEYAS